jgi:hypothetical protein
MDFYKIGVKETRNGYEIYPDFTVSRATDLMVRGKSFYAVWDEEKGLWSTDEYDVPRLVDQDLHEYAKVNADQYGGKVTVKSLESFNSNVWERFRKFMGLVSNNSHDLDSKVTFANTPVTKRDHVSRRLPYDLAPGDCNAWDELVGTLYSVEERAKIEWAIGAIIAGDAKKIQKFLVLYGPPASGKSTVLHIIEKLFEGYVASFEAKALASNNGAFATEVFRTNPLVAVQHDGDLSRIEDNTKLNSIIAHEDMVINEKYKSSYSASINAFLFMGTNQPVRISDSNSGIIRRLIDVHPTGVSIPVNHYMTLLGQIDFELGAIAHRCLSVYQEMGKNYYNGYRPLTMMFKTDIFFNFIEANYDVFSSQDGTTLKQAYSLYKEYCSETGIDRVLPQYKIREELKNYFNEFKDRKTVGDHIVRAYYSGFNANLFKTESKQDKTFSLVMDETVSLFDREGEDWPAQYTKEGRPAHRWDNVKTTLSELDTSQLHYVQVPDNHIVIDFDLKDAEGKKSLEMNLSAASAWPPTYAELSQGGSGVHLHYIYDGNVTELSTEYSNGIEIKTLLGNGALRRRLTKCNAVSIATLKNGLPLKERKMLKATTIQSEKGLRDLIERNLQKGIHPGTKPSIDFIHKILEDAYASGIVYDITDMRPRIVAFANNSTNQALVSLKIVQQMKWKSETAKTDITEETGPLVFFDVEVYPNLFVVCWKYEGDKPVVRMINPGPTDVEQLFHMKLIGFNNRRYDNHILYARYLGYDNEALYKLSQKIISNNVGAMFGEAYNLSYTDIWDFSSKKQGLKKFQIDLGIPHKELDYPWDEPVPEENWPNVVDYCANDVMATEAVFNSRKSDFTAREILAELSGLTVNDTTQKHTAKIIFGNDRNPQKQFVYTDLSKEFDGYVYDSGVSSYRGYSPGEGGYVYAEPGLYTNVALLDVASMHPTSIEQLNLFGTEYTQRFSALKEARMAIKRKDYKAARSYFDGRLAKFLGSDDGIDVRAESLAYALKIVINIVYGLTSAKFDNAFRDIRNKDNIVAKRGALFMIDLQEYVQQWTNVIHIKTDSIKIANATPDLIEGIIAFGRQYGYEFEHEATYDKFCLVNDAVYIARQGDKWTAVGAQFQHPYVYKTLFSNEEVTFDDLCETKQVTQGAMYLDFDYDTPMVLSDGRMRFVGRTGRFVPVKENNHGAMLYRVKDDKYYAVTGTKGYLWLEADAAKALGDELEIDMSYFEHIADEAMKTISKFGSIEELVDV